MVLLEGAGLDQASLDAIKKDGWDMGTFCQMAERDMAGLGIGKGHRIRVQQVQAAQQC